MKKNRGNILLIFLISFVFSTGLYSQEYKWKSYIDKSSAFVNEAIYLKYTCEFEDRGELYVIDFNPKSTDEYKIISLSQSQKILNNKRIQVYEYVVFVKVAGKLDFNFKVNMKKTNKDSIENTVLGRDNAQFEEYATEIFKQETLSIDIKKSSIDLVGIFEIKINKDKDKVKAYEPYHLIISISGIGNLDALEEFKLSNLDAEVFKSKVRREYVLTKDGYKGTFSQKFAFVNDENFSIKEFKINYLNLKQMEVQSLDFKEINVEVEKVYTPLELLDTVDDVSKFDVQYLYFILTFIAGFLVAKIRFRKKDFISDKDREFNQKIQNSKTLEELHMLLILENRHKSIILDIENNKIDSLNIAKKLFKI